MRFAEAQQTRVFPSEIKDREKSTDHFSAYGCDRRTDESVAEHADKQVVEYHIGQSGGNDDAEPKLRFLRSNEETLEDILQHESRHRDKSDARIDHTVTVQLSGCTECGCDKRHDERTEDRQKNTAAECDVNEHGKIFVGFLFLAFSECLGNDRAAAGTDHESKRREPHQKRQDQIDRCKCRLSGIVGYEQSVHDAVDRSKDHHDDGGQYKLY